MFLNKSTNNHDAEVPQLPDDVQMEEMDEDVQEEEKEEENNPQ